MSDRHMTEDEFIALIGAYGGKPENWAAETAPPCRLFVVTTRKPRRC